MKKCFAVLFLLFAAIGASAQSQSSNSVTVQIVAPPAGPTLTSVAPTKAYSNTATTFTLTGTNFNSSCTASWDGATVTSAFVSATSFTVSITAAQATVGSNHLIVVTCPLPILSMNSPVTLPNAKVGAAYSADLKALSGLKGGILPYSFSLSSGSLPTGLSLSSSGVVSGTPSGAGSFSFGFTVKDASGMALLVQMAKIAA